MHRETSVPPAHHSAHDPDAGPDPESPPPAPRWVKVFAILAVVLAVLVVIRHAAGGGMHGHLSP